MHRRKNKLCTQNYGSTVDPDGSGAGGSGTHLGPGPNWNYNWNIEQSTWMTYWRLVGWTEVLQPRIYRRGYIYTSRKGGEAKRAGPSPMCGSWESIGISELQRSPMRSLEPQPHAGLFESRTLEPGRSHITSGSENQQDFCPPERERSLLETKVPS